MLGPAECQVQAEEKCSSIIFPSMLSTNIESKHAQKRPPVQRPSTIWPSRKGCGVLRTLLSMSHGRDIKPIIVTGYLAHLTLKLKVGQWDCGLFHTLTPPGLEERWEPPSQMLFNRGHGTTSDKNPGKQTGHSVMAFPRKATAIKSHWLRWAVETTSL